MKLYVLFLSLAIFLVIRGIWNWYSINMVLEAYSLFSYDNERLLDYLIREYDSVRYKIYKLLGLTSFYESNICIKIKRLFSVLQVLFGLVILICILWVSSSEYAEVLKISL